MKGSTDPVRVLIIEDSEDILFILKTELGFLGYTVEVAGDAKEGLRLAERFHPDVIISDIGLPECDGFELLRRIRKKPALAACPVIALTGLGSESDAPEMQKHGFSAYVVKPVDGASIAKLIQTVIARKTT